MMLFALPKGKVKNLRVFSRSLEAANCSLGLAVVPQGEFCSVSRTKLTLKRGQCKLLRWQWHLDWGQGACSSWRCWELPARDSSSKAPCPAAEDIAPGKAFIARQ